MRQTIKKIGMIGMIVAGMLTACAPGDRIEMTTEAAAETTTSVVEMPTTKEAPLVMVEDVTDWGEPSQVLSGDWNGDGQEDVVRSYWEDIEGGTHGIGIRLQISGAEESNIALSFSNGILEEVLNGDLDGDGQQEIVIIFNSLGNGANGSYGLMLLDQIGEQWIPVTENDLFSGFTYQIRYEKAVGGYLVKGEESGKEYCLPRGGQAQEPLSSEGRATHFYNWTMVNGAEQDRLELWQYIAGEFTIDHVGDMVTTITLQDCQIRLEEEMAVQETLTMCKVKRTGDQLEILPIEHVYDQNTNRLEELKNAGWDLEKLFHDDVMGYYEVPYEEEKITVPLTEAVRYYHRYDENHMIRVTEDEMNFVEDDILRSGRYSIFMEGDQVACIMWDPRQ